MMRAVAGLIETIVREEAVSRWRNLAPADIVAKRPGDLVTTADRAVEDRLATALTAMFPGTGAVGEEHVAQDPRLLSRLGSSTVWLIDPIDGTADYVGGGTRWATQVALCVDGRATASWIHVPLAQTTLSAKLGQGTRLNGRRVSAHPRHTEPVIVTNPRYQDSTDRAAIVLLRAAGFEVSPCEVIAWEYVRIAAGEAGAAVLGWENPWDHAAGLLACAEAGGEHATVTGEAFDLTGGNVLPLIVACDRQLLERLRLTVEQAARERWEH